MIRAKQNIKEDKIAVEVEGDIEQNESELIAILINALSAFSADDILQMLEIAVKYYDPDEAPDIIIN